MGNLSEHNLPLTGSVCFPNGFHLRLFFSRIKSSLRVFGSSRAFRHFDNGFRGAHRSFSHAFGGQVGADLSEDGGIRFRDPVDVRWVHTCRVNVLLPRLATAQLPVMAVDQLFQPNPGVGDAVENFFDPFKPINESKARLQNIPGRNFKNLAGAHRRDLIPAGT